MVVHDILSALCDDEISNLVRYTQYITSHHTLNTLQYI